MSKVAIILGTKAEYIKMMPVFKEFEKRNIDVDFIHTGQHNLDDLIKIFKTQNPSSIVNARDGFKGDTGGAFGWAIKTLPKLIKDLASRRSIEYVICHGDTMSTLISAVAGKLTGKKVIHIEAGLRSGNLREPFPEEIVRRITDSISHIKFAVSDKTAARLNSEVYNVGNTGNDALKLALKTAKFPKEFPKKYAICTVHRHENIKSKERMQSIVEILDSVVGMPVYFAMHKNTLSKLDEYGLKMGPNIRMVDHKTYSEFVGILKYSNLIITDGGSMQEEAAVLDIPCLVLRMATEREELLARRDQCLSLLNPPTALGFLDNLDMFRHDSRNPYYNGGAAKQIVDVMVRK